MESPWMRPTETRLLIESRGTVGTDDKSERAVSVLECAAVSARHDRGADGREVGNACAAPTVESTATESEATIRVESASPVPAKHSDIPTIREFNMIRAPLHIGGGVDPEK